MGQTPGSIVRCGHVMPFSHRKNDVLNETNCENCQEESVEIESSSDSEDPVTSGVVISCDFWRATRVPSDDGKVPIWSNLVPILWSCRCIEKRADVRLVILDHQPEDF